jgi:hypothetical protein
MLFKRSALKQSGLSERSTSTSLQEKLSEACYEEVHKKYFNESVQRATQRVACYLGVSLDTFTRIWQICRGKLIDPQRRP